MKKKKTVTLPRTYNPGKGHPQETLAYLSPVEHDLIRRLTDGKWNRGPKGVKSYADDSASSKGVSRGDSSGTKGSGGLGQGGQGAGGNSGSRASSSPSGGVSTGGGLRGAGSNTGPGSGRPGSGSSAASSAASGGQRGAGSNYGPGSGRPGSGGTFGGVAKAAQDNAARASGAAPNAAAQAAFDRQRMNAISNRYDPVTRGAAPNPKGAMAGASPADFARTALGYNINKMDKMGVTDANRIVDGFNNLKQFADVTYDPVGLSKIQKNLGYTPIGIRSNNPGNLMMPSGEQWQKEVPGYAGPMTSPNGLTYQSFTDPRWGMVAQNELLGRYADAGRNTINSVVDRYAPVDQNNSAAANAAYKNNLSERTGFGLNDQLTREQVQSLGPYKTAFENGGVAFAGGPFGPSAPTGVQVAGIANAGVNQADALARAQKAAAGLDAVRQGATPTPTLPNDPRLGLPRGSFPLGEIQGPQRYSGPLDKIPQPASQGMFGAPSVFANDPRLSLPQGSFPAGPQIATDPRVSKAPLGSFPAAREPSQVMTDPRVSKAPLGGFPAAQGYSTVVTDPRVALTPLGTLPAAKPPKEVQLAWNVPPMGGALPSQSAWGLGQWGTYRNPPAGPAASPGTIHSQTASSSPATTTDSAPSKWETPDIGGWIKANTGVDVNQKVADVKKQVEDVKKTAGWKFAQEHPKLAAFGLKMMMAGGGGNPNSTLGTAQDRSRYRMPLPQPYQPQMAQAEPQQQADPLTSLNSLLANMISKGAKPEEIAYVQSLINELTKTQVA